MISISISIILCINLISSNYAADYGRNEEECSKRRCCLFRYHKTGKYTEKTARINCNELSDEKCGSAEYGEFCEWDCDPVDKQDDPFKIERRFMRISPMKGEYTEPKPILDDTSPTPEESYRDCLNNGQLTVTDDCGVEYFENINQESLESFCKTHPKDYASGGNYKFEGTGSKDYDPKSRRRLLDVIPNDDRIGPIVSTSFPWRAVLYMEFDTPTGRKRCTAQMISSRWAITAAHCVWGSGDWYSNFRVYKNVFECNDRDAAHDYYVNTIATFTAYTTGSTWSYDIGWLRLTQNPSLGWFGFGYNSGFSGTRNFNIISYPADQPDCSKWYQYCPYDNPWRTHTMTTWECDTSGGASGSGIYLYWPSSSNRRIYGIFIQKVHVMIHLVIIIM